MVRKEIPTRTEVFDDFLTKDKPNESGVDTSDWFKSEERTPRRIAMTFTLDPRVIALVEKAAEKNRLSRSRIIEKIALKVLG